jgi:hypothetical protein
MIRLIVEGFRRRAAGLRQRDRLGRTYIDRFGHTMGQLIGRILIQQDNDTVVLTLSEYGRFGQHTVTGADAPVLVDDYLHARTPHGLA